MKSTFLVAIAFTVCFMSCQKEEINNISPVNPDLQSNESMSSETVHNLAAGTYTLTLQPGPNDGDDLWTKNWIGHPAYADTCDTKVALVKGLAYYLTGSIVYTRSVIKFDSLSKVPAGATVLSATLYLYGPKPTSKDVKKHLPMGNTSYPGSNKGDNTCYLQRITGNWNQHTISWNNPPVTTTTDQYIMAASDKQWQYDVALNVTDMIKPMVAGFNANNGFLLRLKTEEKPRAMGFLSADSPEAKRRPKLVVTYSL